MKKAEMTDYYKVKQTFTDVGHMVKSVLYEPDTETPNSHIGLVCLHSHGNYMGFSTGPEMAKRGYRVLCSATKGEGEVMEDKLLAVKANVEYMRNLSGIDTVLVVGHSGGATLISCYQTTAENGVQLYQGPKQIIPMQDIGPLPAADGVVFLDSNWGNAILTLLSMDPSVKDETTARGLNPEFDMYAVENGYDPDDPLGPQYSEEFVHKYLIAQKQRNDRVIDRALDRLYLIERGLGRFADDEPFVVVGGSCTSPNKLYAQNLRVHCRTSKERDLMHADGSVTHGIVPCLRKRGAIRGGQANRNTLRQISLNTTVKSFLTNYAVRGTDELAIGPSLLTGIDYDTTFAATTANVRHQHSPTLVMGMTGGQGVTNNEYIFENLAAEDKTLMYVEGATHTFTPYKDGEAFPGQFGDTTKLVYDYVDRWINAGRFSR